jgi:hypothetical protein
MRCKSIPALAAVLSLGASGVLSSVIPKPREFDSSAGFLAEEATLCIKDFCATKWNEEQPKKQCGTIVLTVTHLGAPSSIEDCVSQFSYLIAQDTESGTSQTEEALYEISAEDDSEPATNEKRAKKPKHKETPKAQTTAAASTSSKVAFSKASSIAGKPSETPKNSIVNKPSSTVSSIKTSSSIKSTGSKISSSATSSATPSASACPLPRKGKDGKPIHRRCAGNEFYKKEDLIVGKVTHWRFNTMGDVSKYNADANAKSVLQKMKVNGQLDVVKVSNGDLTVVGNTEGGTVPMSFTKKGGNYLLTNGGYFQHLSSKPNFFEPAGEETTVKTADGTVKKYANPFPLPEEYADVYTRIDGLENTKVFSGPDLKLNLPTIDGKAGIWKYKSTGNPVGSLNHAAEANERLALVRFGATHYSIAYTCKNLDHNRICGLPTNSFKVLIDLFFSKMGETGKSIGKSDKAVCLDGGPSVSMIWNQGSTEKVLSLGNNDDGTPIPGADIRKVSNLLKISAK